jgi:hypothetical protein
MQFGSQKLMTYHAIDKRNPLRDEIAGSEKVSIEKSVSASFPAS